MKIIYFNDESEAEAILLWRFVVFNPPILN